MRHVFLATGFTCGDKQRITYLAIPHLAILREFRLALGSTIIIRDRQEPDRKVTRRKLKHQSKIVFGKYIASFLGPKDLAVVQMMR